VSATPTRPRRRLAAAAALAAVAASGALVIGPAVTQAAPTTTCNGRTITTDVAGNLRVPNGAAPCHLAAGVTVDGDVTVGTRTSLILDGPGVMILGRVSVNSRSLFQALSFHSVDGGISTDGGNVVIQNGHVGGPVDLMGSTSNQDVSNEIIAGDLRIFRVRTPGHVQMAGNTVDGSVTLIDNTAPVVLGLSTVGGDVTAMLNKGGLTLWQNTVYGSTFAYAGGTQTDIAQNDIAGDLVCDANDPAPTNDVANPNDLPNAVGGARVGQCADFESGGQAAS
jgi:hypothetical protein